MMKSLPLSSFSTSPKKNFVSESDRPIYNEIKRRIQEPSRYHLLGLNSTISALFYYHIGSSNPEIPYSAQIQEETLTLTHASLIHLQKQLHKKLFKSNITLVSDFENKYRIQVFVPTNPVDTSDCSSEASDGWDKSFSPSSITEVFQNRRATLIKYATNNLRALAVNKSICLLKKSDLDSTYDLFDAVNPACDILRKEGFSIDYAKDYN